MSIGRLARVGVGAFLWLAPMYLVWRTTTVGSGWLLALSMPWLWSEAWSLIQLVALRHEVLGGRRSRRWREAAAHDDHLVAARDLEVAIVVAPSATVVDVERSIVGLQATGAVARVTVLVPPERRAELIEHSRHWRLDDFQLVGVAHGVPVRPADRLDVVLDNTRLRWVLWLEAGQVPMPDMVEQLERRPIGGRVAVSQIAVGLLNPRSLAHVNRYGDDRALERRVVGPARAEGGLAPWHGPGSILRRPAFEDVSPIDDPAVSALSRYAVALKRAGWRFDYEPRPLVRVPAADSLHPYLAGRRQRSLLALEELGLAWTTPGVPWPARRAALAAAVATTQGIRQLATLMILVGCSVAGRLPVVADDGRVLIAMAAFWAGSVVARRVLSAGTIGIGDWAKHGWRTLGADIAALAPRFAKPLQVLHPRLGIAHRGSLGRMQLLTVTFAVFELAVAARALTVLSPILLPAMSRRDSAVLLVVCIGATIGLVAVVGGLARDQGRRRSPRVELHTEITVAGTPGTTIDVTPSGLGALVEPAPPVGTAAPIRFVITGRDGVERPVEAIGGIRSATLHESGSVRVGIEFDDIAIEHRMAITEFCALGSFEADANGHASADHLDPEVSFGQLAMVRALAALSVLVAAAAVMLGPRADVVAAQSTTEVPSVFTPTAGGERVAPNPELTVRLHTEYWSAPLQATDDGVFQRGKTPSSWEGPVYVEIALGDDRHVDTVAVDGMLRLGVVDVAETVSATVVGPSGRRRFVTTGDPLVPGPYTVGWSVENRDPRTAAVQVGGDQILQIRADGVTVVSVRPDEADRVEPVDGGG